MVAFRSTWEQNAGRVHFVIEQASGQSPKQARTAPSASHINTSLHSVIGELQCLTRLACRSEKLEAERRELARSIARVSASVAGLTTAFRLGHAYLCRLRLRHDRLVEEIENLHRQASEICRAISA